MSGGGAQRHLCIMARACSLVMLTIPPLTRDTDTVPELVISFTVPNGAPSLLNSLVPTASAADVGLAAGAGASADAACAGACAGAGAGVGVDVGADVGAGAGVGAGVGARTSAGAGVDAGARAAAGGCVDVLT
jgi:hypothetical protein